jgi:hypothetical protein
MDETIKRAERIVKNKIERETREGIGILEGLYPIPDPQQLEQEEAQDRCLGRFLLWKSKNKEDK